MNLLHGLGRIAILMAHETHSLVKDAVLADEGDTLIVKGFAKPVPILNLLALKEGAI